MQILTQEVWLILQMKASMNTWLTYQFSFDIWYGKIKAIQRDSTKIIPEFFTDHSIHLILKCVDSNYFHAIILKGQGNTTILLRFCRRQSYSLF